MRRVHLFIQGKVQGVYYRQSCAQEARAKHINGYVRNLHDGRVEAVLEGEDLAIEEMIAWCRRGPPSAVVQNVELHESTPVGETRFEVQA
jgi:acylphosphatase